MTREKWNDKVSTMTKPPTEEDFIVFLNARLASKESKSLAKYHPYSDSSSFKMQQTKKPKDKKMLCKTLLLPIIIYVHSLKVPYAPVPDC